MNKIDDKTYSKSCEASAWLCATKPKEQLGDLLNSYPEGPIFRGQSARQTLDFLKLRSDFESQSHIHDYEMDGVVLTIEFEINSMCQEKMELVFSFSHPEHEGSISHSLSAIRSTQSEFLVFGDDANSQIV